MDAPLSFHGTLADPGACSIPTPTPSIADSSVPALSTSEAEEFFTSGEQAWPKPVDPSAVPSPVHLKISTHTCCQGVDVPGVGHAHAPDCQAATVTAMVNVAGLRDISKETRSLIAKLDAALGPIDAWREQRSALLGQLVSAARELAEQNIIGRKLPDTQKTALLHSEFGETWCRECQMNEHLGELPHTATCKTGRLLRVLGELAALSVPRLLIRPEQEEEAGDGTRLRGLKERVCLQCGERGGAWNEEIRPEAPQSAAALKALALNQCVGAGFDGGHILHTHLCKPVGARVCETCANALDDCNPDEIGNCRLYKPMVNAAQGGAR